MADTMKLDGRKHRLDLDLSGGCLPVLSTCSAACCSHWDEGLSQSEHDSGQYPDEAACTVDQKACRNHFAICPNRIYRMRKQPDGACICLGPDNRCTIYETRPQVCRDFTCKGGWYLATVFPFDAEASTSPEPVSLPRTLPVAFTPDMIFVRNPLIALRTVFVDAHEVVLVVKSISHCTVVPHKGETREPVPDRLFTALDEVIDGERTLEQIFGSARVVCMQDAGVEITLSMVYDAVFIMQQFGLVAYKR